MTSPQQLPPADDFYLAAHDGIGGRALLSPPVLGVGLAATLLGELLFWRRLQLVPVSPSPSPLALAGFSAGGSGAGGFLLRVIDSQPTGDPASSAVLRRLVETPGPHEVRQWIRHLSAGFATDVVEHRLTLTGVLRRETKRRLLTSNTSLVFTDPRTPGEPAGRIRTKLSYNEPLDTADLMVAGLFLATGLDQLVLDTLNPRDRARLSDQFRRSLPQPLHHLVSAAREAALVTS
ncbi:GPP34 family phosphoprotein [Actinoplanes missouriensis]|uniref:GOLPH3/VPS74 family protein n=1 Tax=Actinoplanes missouriensis TaxID=1866 RepID=UPI0033DDB152